jgi:hypothetical protein
MKKAHSNGSHKAPTITTEALDADTRGRIKAARTKRLKRRMKPFEGIDAEVVSLLERITPPEGEEVGTNVARTILQAQTLRKELLLGKLRAEEIEDRLEATNIREEWEVVKRVLGITQRVG